MERTQLVLYTVVMDYGATGEGRTLSVWIGFALDLEDARAKFQSAVPNGDFWAQGAEVFEGVNTQHEVCQTLLTPVVVAQILDTHCMREFSAQLHVNYS